GRTVRASAASNARPRRRLRSWKLHCPGEREPARQKSTETPSRELPSVRQQLQQTGKISSCRFPLLSAWLDLEHGAGGFISQQVNVTIRRLSHIAETLT